MVNQAILEWQNALPSFGITYQGPKDGQINQAFIDAMMALEGKYKVYGQIFTGSGTKMSVMDAKKKFLLPDTPAKKSIETSKLPESPSIKVWESFFSSNLPIVGKVYEGDLVNAAKKIEVAIGKAINKPVVGMIWDDTKKQFNTTPDDVKKALDLIQTHVVSTNVSDTKTSKLNLDQRIILMSQLLLGKNHQNI